MGQRFGATVVVVAVEPPVGQRAAISPSGRRSLWGALRKAATAAQISLTRLHPMDRPGGMSLVADGNILPEMIAGPLLAEWNSALADTEPIVRCRIAMHQGLVTVIGDDWFGDALAFADKMVHASQLHRVLGAARGARIALIISDEFHRTVVAPGPRGLDPSTFARIAIAAEGEQRCAAWVSVIGYPWPPVVTEEPEQREARNTSISRPEHPGARQGGGISIAGNATVLGDMFTGDKVVSSDSDIRKSAGSAE